MVMEHDGPALSDSNTLTLKGGKDFDSPWIVVYGNHIAQRRQLVSIFGIEDDPEVSLAELTAKLAVDFQALCALAKSGATQQTSSSRRSTSRKTESKSEPAKGTPSAAAEAEEEAAEAVDPVLKAIQDATDLDELKAAWAANQDAFVDNRPLQGAYKEKQKELKGS